jgi:hypothetical protein
VGGINLIARSLSPEEMARNTKIAPEFRTEFSNHIRIAMSETDIRFVFGESLPTSSGEIIVTERFGVALAPQHAKGLLSSLARLIGEYEKAFGTIKPATDIPSINEDAPKQPK